MIPGVPVIDRDEHVWVLNKPAGLLSVPGRGPHLQDCLSARVQSVDPHAQVVHRLDQPTSGLMIMARSVAVQRQLHSAFAQRQVSKVYVAVVDGLMPMSDTWSSIDAPIGLHWPDRPRHHVGPQGKPSLTGWRVVAQDPNSQRTLVALRPHTGRSHQLRVHLQWIGHPMVGDTLYAPPELAQASPRLLLHAWRLQLTHPIYGDNRDWAAPIPAELLNGFCQQAVVQGLHNALIAHTQETFYA
jgi:tRNA pseudouridine32 synthase/23S rRNA pseudouridine746 synthase